MRRALVGDVRLYLVTGAPPGSAWTDDVLARVIDAGVGMVQLREKALDDRSLVDTALRFARVCRQNGALFIVNDRVDVAMLSGADGVHVGQDDVRPNDIRRIAGEDFIIGLSTHSPDQIDAAMSTSADYFGVGPIFETPTKPGRPAVGLDLVRYAASHSSRPFFAIGGIDAQNVSGVRAAGAASIAVLRYVTQAPDPAAAVRTLLDELMLNK